MNNIVIKMNDNKTLSLISSTNIYQGEHNADKLVFLFPITYDELSITECTSTLYFMNSDDQAGNISLIYDENLYNDEYITASVPVTNIITQTSGNLKLWVEIVNGANIVVLKTSKVNMTISDHTSSSEVIPEASLDIINYHEIRLATAESKLLGVEENANNYVHPPTHEASIIVDDAAHRFTTDEEKNVWNSKADGVHSHDDLYYTEGEIDTKLSGKSDIGHTHDDLYYTEDEIDNMLLASTGLPPETLNTIEKVASAIGNDSLFFETISDEISSKADAVHQHSILDINELQDTIDNKSDVSHTHAELHTHDNNDLLDSLITTGDGTQYLSNDGTYKAISGGTGGGGAYQSVHLNVSINDVLTINSTDTNKCIIQPYNYIPGESDVAEVLKTFDNGDSGNFYFDNENIVFDGVIKINDTFDLASELNGDNLYESDAIIKNEYDYIGGIAMSL